MLFFVQIKQRKQHIDRLIIFLRLGIKALVLKNRIKRRYISQAMQRNQYIFFYT